MCTAALTLGLQVAGTAAGMYQSYQQSQTMRQGLKYEASVQRNNAQLAEWQAQDALRRGREEESDTRTRTAQLKGRQRAVMAARGLDLSEGSPLQILTDTDFMGERDALRVRGNAAREAWAHREQAKGYTDAAGLLSSRAQAQSPGGAAFGTFLGGAGQVASRWYEFRKQGAF